jgi:hypothetical protein
MLDYIIRRFFWFKILPYNEISFRLPSLIFGITTVLFSFAASFYFFTKNKISFYFALFSASAIGLWVATHRQEVFLSGYGRHYTLVSLVSCIWCYCVFFLDIKKVPFFLISLIYANLHFFSFPVILFGGVFRATKRFLEKQSSIKQSLLELIPSVLAIWLSMKWNHRAMNGVLDTHGRPVSLLKTFKDAFLNFLGYYSYLDITWAGVLCGCVILLFLSFKEENKKYKFNALAVVLALTGLTYAFFLVSLLRSGDFVYAVPLATRYYSPFLGLGLSLFFMMFFFLGNLQKKYKYIVLVPVLLFSLFLVPSIGEAWQLWKNKKIPDGNFSIYHQTYKELAASEKPLLVIHSRCWAYDVPETNFNVFLGYSKNEVRVLSSTGCNDHLEEAREVINSFLAAKSGTLALDNPRDNFYPCKPTGEFKGAYFEKVSTGMCAYKVKGVSSIEQLNELMKYLQFETKL